jgi:hypothetical protein
MVTKRLSTVSSTRLLLENCKVQKVKGVRMRVRVQFARTSKKYVCIWDNCKVQKVKGVHMRVRAQYARTSKKYVWRYGETVKCRKSRVCVSNMHAQVKNMAGSGKTKEGEEARVHVCIILMSAYMHETKKEK